MCYCTALAKWWCLAYREFRWWQHNCWRSVSVIGCGHRLTVAYWQSRSTLLNKSRLYVYKYSAVTWSAVGYLLFPLAGTHWRQYSNRKVSYIWKSTGFTTRLWCSVVLLRVASLLSLCAEMSETRQLCTTLRDNQLSPPPLNSTSDKLATREIWWITDQT